MFDAIEFALCRVYLTPDRPTTLPEDVSPGTLLRDRFGSALRHSVCPLPHNACEAGCLQPAQCAYAHLFATSLQSQPAAVAGTTRGGDLYRPFVFEPPLRTRPRYDPRTPLAINLLLVGTAIDHLPTFLLGLRAMGRTGFGEPRAEWTVERVHSLSQSEATDGPVLHIAERPGITLEPLRHRYDMLATIAARMPTERLMLEFVTPLRIEEKGILVREFTAERIYRALLRRLYDLSSQWCGVTPEGDMRTLLDRLVERTQLKTLSLNHTVWTRQNNRANKRLPFDGITGRLLIEGDLAESLPLLLAGEYLHLGKQTVFGMGRYRLDLRPSI